MSREKDMKNEEYMRLFFASQRRLYSYVMMLVPSPSDADDIVQDVAAVLWSRFDEYESGTDFTSWALKIAKYKIYNYFRNQKSYRKVFSQKSMEIIERIASQEAEKEGLRIEAIRHCITKLSTDEQRILYLRYNESRTLQKLATYFNMNINTLYSRLSKIHLVLMNCISSSIVE